MSHALAQTQLEAIQAACRQHQVQRMPLFGSALRPGFDLERQRLHITGKLVDLVMADAGRNPYVRADIEASRRARPFKMLSLRSALMTMARVACSVRPWNASSRSLAKHGSNSPMRASPSTISSFGA